MAVWEEPEVNEQGPGGSSSGRLSHEISLGEDLDRVGQPRHLQANATRRSCSMARTPGWVDVPVVLPLGIPAPGLLARRSPSGPRP
jgi:hypothetical protein